jgi:acyl carrier protein
LELISEIVSTQVAWVLGHSSSAAIEPESQFGELGFDSLTAVELRNGLSTRTGLRLPTSLIFDYPTVGQLAEHLVAQIDPAAEDSLPPVLADLDALEAALDRNPPDEVTRGGVALRLRRLLQRISDPADVGPGNDARDRLQSASADDLLAFIDNELGRRHEQ